MQIASSTIWTRVANAISHDDVTNGFDAGCSRRLLSLTDTVNLWNSGNHKQYGVYDELKLISYNH